MENKGSSALNRLRNDPGPSLRRWAVLSLLFAATVLNYVDRQTLSLLAPTIQKDIGMSDRSYAGIVQLFLIAYTLAYLVAGKMTDKLGVRLSLALFVGWWSLAGVLAGWVRTTWEMGAARFMLGLGEAGNYTAAPKAVGQWFAPNERGLAVGIYTAGAMIGATVAPPLIGWLALTHGWRSAFIATGGAGFVWVAVWLMFYREPTSARVGEGGIGGPWREIIALPSVWRLVAARLLTDPVWYFYLFWFPKYLSDERGLGLAALAGTAWVVYLAADVGSVGGGYWSGILIRAGRQPVQSRLVLMGIAAVLAPIGIFNALSPPLVVTLVLAAVVAACHLTWQVNLTAMVVDLHSGRNLGTVFGMVAAGSGLGGVISTPIIGELVVRHGYMPVFVFLALLHPIALLVIRRGSRRGAFEPTAA